MSRGAGRAALQPAALKGSVGSPPCESSASFAGRLGAFYLPQMFLSGSRRCEMFKPTQGCEHTRAPEKHICLPCKQTGATHLPAAKYFPE